MIAGLGVWRSTSVTPAGRGSRTPVDGVMQGGPWTFRLPTKGGAGAIRDGVTAAMGSCPWAATKVPADGHGFCPVVAMKLPNPLVGC